MDNKFSLKNFIIKEAEEDISIKKKNSTDIQVKNTQESTQINKEEDDSYGIPSDNETEKNTSKEFAAHRLILQKEIYKDEIKSKKILKRKQNPKFEKKDNKKRIVEHIKKNINLNEIQTSLGIINGKLNIGFAENKENRHNNDDNNKTPEKKIVEESDDEIVKLKISNEKKKIENVNKKMNNDFIKRMKENENFIKNNNIIMADGSDVKFDKNMKRNKSEDINKKNNFGHKRLKLYNFKGAFLNKNK